MRLALSLLALTCFALACDARKLFGEGWTEPKVCAQSNPDCVFHTASGVKQQICGSDTGQCGPCGMLTGPFDLVAGTKQCRDGYSQALICDKDVTTCRSCRVGNQECVNADKTKPVCDTGSGECRTCSSAPECKAEGFIACSGGQCQPCATNMDCLAVDQNNPTCDKSAGASPVCRGCLIDAECDTQLCDTGKNPLVSEGKVGRCVPKNSIAWVDNSPSCNSAGADGSDAKPFCTADAAYNSGAKYLYLKPSGTTYTLSAAISRDLILIGKGTDPSNVTVGALGFNVAGKLLSTTNLTIKDTGKILVQCTGGTVRLYKTYLDGGFVGGASNGPRGIDASGGCTEIEIQQSKIANLASAGISIVGSTQYTVVNTGIFFTAMKAESSVILNTTAAGLFAFNTVRLSDNRGSASSGGIDCGNVIDNRKIVSTVVMDNNYGANNSQLAGKCALTKVVVGAVDLTTLPGAIKKSCSFANTTDGRLAPTDTNCVDQADPVATISTDFFGTMRPLGSAPDIGYHEVR